MNIGTERNRQRLKTDISHFVTKERQCSRNTVFCCTNTYINLVLPSVTREYYPKVFELLDLLQCIAAYVQRTQPWVYTEGH